MKKEEMQQEINNLLEELKAKDFLLDELKKEREKQDSEIENLRKEIQVRNEAIALLEDEKQSNVHPAGESVGEEFGKLKKVLVSAAGIIRDSCLDHCPHKGNPNACANCGLNLRIQASGIYSYLENEKESE